MNIGHIVRKGVNKLGIDVTRLRRGGGAYETIYPLARYAPWRKDAAFMDTYAKIINCYGTGHNHRS